VATPHAAKPTNPLSRFALHPLGTCVLAGSLAILVRLLLLPLIPIPIPQVHDEFSYLLGADTFASGRLTNPPHPMWVHFETFHVNMQPTYHSKYLPAQAIFLAFGRRVAGHPWFGVCLAMGLMFAALCWMLQGWVAPPYALAATLLAMLEWGFTTYWINSYWGGAVPALAGALIIGAVPRLARRIDLAPVLAAITGAVLLANSRPYEGLLTVLSSGAVLWWWIGREKRPLSVLLRRRVLLPVAAIALPVLLAMGYYNFRTTGKVTRLPYAVNQETYSASPQFYFLPPTPIPAYRHEVIRKLWVDWDRQLYLAARRNPLAPWKFSAPFILPFYVLNLLGLAAFVGLFTGKRSTVLPALGVLALPLLGVMLEKGFVPHYLAPICGVWLILAAAAMEACGERGRAGGVAVLVVLAVAIGSCVSEIAGAAHLARQTPAGLDNRPRLIAGLERQGGRHLIVVRYTPAHSPHVEWVYNDADIDGAPVVWARDMGEEKNRELLDYFKDRQVWLFEPDMDPAALKPYP
jgi:hypothetical protein